jgi:hypothetical protein
LESSKAAAKPHILQMLTDDLGWGEQNRWLAQWEAGVAASVVTPARDR